MTTVSCESASVPIPLANSLLHYLPTLRLFFAGGVSNDYRLSEELVQFRTNEGPWRILDESDIELHYRFNTEVGRWLRSYRLHANPHRKRT